MTSTAKWLACRSHFHGLVNSASAIVTCSCQPIAMRLSPREKGKNFFMISQWQIVVLRRYYLIAFDPYKLAEYRESKLKYLSAFCSIQPCHSQINYNNINVRKDFCVLMVVVTRVNYRIWPLPQKHHCWKHVKHVDHTSESSRGHRHKRPQLSTCQICGRHEWIITWPLPKMPQVSMCKHLTWQVPYGNLLKYSSSKDF